MRGRGNTPSDDWFSSAKNPGATCEDFCRCQTLPACEACGTTCEHTIFGKCYDAISETPLNGIRLAFPSQIDTMNYDPSLPTFEPYPNASICMRMNYFHFILYVHIKF